MMKGKRQQLLFASIHVYIIVICPDWVPIRVGLVVFIQNYTVVRLTAVLATPTCHLDPLGSVQRGAHIARGDIVARAMKDEYKKSVNPSGEVPSLKTNSGDLANLADSAASCSFCVHTSCLMFSTARGFKDLKDLEVVNLPSGDAHGG